MPARDWDLVPAGTYHAFHSAWITHLQETLNGGLLPEGYYALAEQHAGHILADILTLHIPEGEPSVRGHAGSVAVAESPPQVSRKRIANPNAGFRAARRTVAIRHVSNHRLTAIIEITSPANKDRPASVREFAEKIQGALQGGCHVLLLDLIPPGQHDPRGLHGAIWEDIGEEEALPADQPLTLAAYVARRLPEAYVEPLALGAGLPEMPLFLEFDRYINVPLEATHEAAYRGMPAYWRGVLEGREPPPHA